VAISKIPPFKVQVREPSVYYDDALTGGQTIVLNIEPSETLFSLQQIVGDTLKPFVNRQEDNVMLDIYSNEPLKSSYQKYRYAFLGSHWKPHFSIASLKIPKHDPFIDKFKRLQVNFNFFVTEISVWHIEGDKHSKIKTLKLKEE
jgi:hypothetical protein